MPESIKNLLTPSFEGEKVDAARKFVTARLAAVDEAVKNGAPETETAPSVRNLGVTAVVNHNEKLAA